MTYLLDTNIISEIRKLRPEPRVLEWLDALDEDRAYLSIATLAEIRRGVGLLPDGRKRSALAQWLQNDLIDRFAGRLLPLDGPVAFAWGDLMAQSKIRGQALSTMDGWIAATAIVHDLTLVTRNRKDFRHLGLDLFDPWEVGS